MVVAEAAALDPPVDPARDHIRGARDAPLTLVEYADYECPFSARAAAAVLELLERFGDELRFVFRHKPLLDVHPHAAGAAEAAESAAAQDEFWAMHDLLFRNQEALEFSDLVRYARAVGLDPERFAADMRERAHIRRVAEDLASADASGVTGTPTFFVNGRRYEGRSDADGLAAALRRSASG